MSEAIYAGSFDPITNGHVDIIDRAARQFDKVHVAVIQNPDKNSLFTTEKRIELIRSIYQDNAQISVEGFHGLLVDYAKRKQVFTLIRGLRAVSDFDYEFQMALMNRSIDSKIDTVFLMTDSKYSYLSSSIVKQLASFNATVSEFVPPVVEKALKSL